MDRGVFLQSFCRVIFKQDLVKCWVFGKISLQRGESIPKLINPAEFSVFKTKCCGTNDFGIFPQLSLLFTDIPSGQSTARGVCHLSVTGNLWESFQGEIQTGKSPTTCSGSITNPKSLVADSWNLHFSNSASLQRAKISAELIKKKIPKILSLLLWNCL